MQSQFDIIGIKEKTGFSVWIYVLVIDWKQDVVGWRTKYLEIIAVIKTGSIRKLGNFTCFMFHFSVSPVSYFRFCGTTACQVTAVEQVFQVFSFSFYPIFFFFLFVILRRCRFLIYWFNLGGKIRVISYWKVNYFLFVQFKAMYTIF